MTCSFVLCLTAAGPYVDGLDPGIRDRQNQFTQRPRTGLVMCRGSGVHEHFINISRLEQVKHLGGEMFFL